MKTISSIQWTDKSIEHIARHAVKPGEVEEVCFNENESPFIRSGRDGFYYVFGQTYAGRFLFVVVSFIKQGRVRIVTVRDMNAWERNYFVKRGK